MKAKFCTIVLLLLGKVSLLCAGSNYAFSTDTSRNNLIVSGSWRFLEVLHADSSLKLNRKGIDSLLGKTIYLGNDKIALSGDTCFRSVYEEVPTKFLPEYRRKNYPQLNFNQVCGDCKELRVIQMVCKSSPTNSIHTRTGYDIFYITDRQIAIYLQGVLFLLERTDGLEHIPQAGDTVRCRYSEGGTCTGFMIQGTRGTKIIHVKPTNKNVPLEVE